MRFYYKAFDRNDLSILVDSGVMDYDSIELMEIRIDSLNNDSGNYLYELDLPSSERCSRNRRLSNYDEVFKIIEIDSEQESEIVIQQEEDKLEELIDITEDNKQTIESGFSESQLEAYRQALSFESSAVETTQNSLSQALQSVSDSIERNNIRGFDPTSEISCFETEDYEDEDDYEDDYEDEDDWNSW